MQNRNEHWERLAAVIRQAGNMSPNFFAKYIGLPCGENIYRVKRGQNGISRNMADMIVAKFPHISKGWLLTGEGDMFVDEAQQSAQIPFYDCEIESVLAGEIATPAYYLYISMLKDCDLAVKYHNTVLFLKKTEAEMLKDDKEYLFLAKKRVYLHKWSPESEIELDADDKIYLVQGRLEIYK